MGRFGRVVLPGFLVALFAFALPAFAANVTVNGTTSFSSLDGSVDDQDHVVNGIFTVNGDLIVNGTINCNDDTPGNTSACSMRFDVTGNVIMNAGSGIFAEDRHGSGSGGNITINAGGTVSVHGPAATLGGAVISTAAFGSATGNGGTITINSGDAAALDAGSVLNAGSKGNNSGNILITSGGSITVAGVIASGPSATLLATRQTGTIFDGGVSHQHGGEIRVQSTSVLEPAITINSTATIASQGQNAAGPVTIEGCGVIIRGLVASLSGEDTATRVAVRSGKGITIDATDLGISAVGSRLGHVRADANGGSAGSKRADLFAAEAITVIGPDPSLSTIYTVSSVPGSEQSVAGGTIRAISLNGIATASGRAFLAGRDADNNAGGTISIATKGTATLDHASLEAVGGFSSLKASAAGGTIAVRSYSGNVSWTLGLGDVRPVGAAASGVAAQGTITLTACGTVATSGTSFPTNGPAVGVFPTITTGSCSPSAPSLPAGEPALPVCCNVITVINPAVSSGPAGSPFSQTFTQVGAIGTATFSIATGTLPSGLTLATNGVLSGTPTVTGSFPITVMVTDSQGCTGVGPTYPLTITCPTITVTNPAVDTGVAGAAFSQTFTQSGGVGTTTFSLAGGTLPTGLTLSSAGVLSGTPTQTGSFPITVKATDSNGCTGIGPTYNLTITCQTITVTNPAVNSGVAGVAFSQTFTQSGGIGTTTFSLASGTLPTGLTLSSAGVLSGTPTQTGSFPITVKATDSNGCSGTGPTYNLTITCQTITVTNPAGNSGVAGCPFSETFTQSGGIGTTTFSLASGTLPTGLNLASNGVLSGTPTQTGTFNITVKATDANGCSGTGPTYTLTIACQTITVTNPAVSSGTAGTPFSQSFTQSGAVGTATFSIASGTLPSGLTLSAAGVLSGTPTQSGSFPITVKVTDSNGCTGTGPTYTLVITCQTITVTNPANSTGTVGSPFSETFTQSGANGTATFTTSSTLPTGLSLSAAGVLSGTSTQTGTFPIVVTVTDSNGCTGTGPTYTLVINCQTITVTNPATNSGTVDSPFSATFTQSGAIGTATFSIASGSLPAGLSLSSSGVLSGTPQVPGTFVITVKVTDSNGCTGTGPTYTLTISCQTITVTNPSSNSGTYNVALSGSFTFTQSGVGTHTPAVFTINSGSLPSGVSLSSSGVLSGTPTQTGVFSITVKVTDANGCTGIGSTYTLTIAPNAVNKSYIDVGNTQLAAGVAAPATPTVIAAALSSGDSADVAITYAVTAPPVNGTLTIFNSNGTFLYTPNVGNTATDSFTYTATANGVSVTRTATITFTGRVWYVDNATGAGTNDGRSNTPVTTMTAVGGAGTASGDFIYVSKGSGPTTGAYTMLSSQQLIGAGATLNVGSGVLVVAGNAANTPTLSGTLTLASSVTVKGIDMSTGASDAIDGTNVSAINVFARNITTTTGTAININAATGTMTFTSVSANGGANGIVLQNFTGGTSSFSVTGTGSAASGGTIRNMVGADGASAGNGVYLNNAVNVSLASMQFNDFQNFAIRGLSVNGFALTGSVINGTNGTNPATPFNEGGVAFDELTGSVSISNSNVSGAIYDNFRVRNTSGSLNRLTFSGVTIGANSTANGNDGVLLSASSNATMNVTVQNSFFTSSRGDLFQLNLADAAVSDLVFIGNALSNNHPAIVTGGGGVTISGGNNTTISGVTLTYNIANNSFRDSIGAAVLIVKGTDPGSFSGTFTNNTIGVAGINDSGSFSGSGLKLQNAGLGILTAHVTDNQIRQYNNFGIELVAGGGATALSGALNFTITGNTIANPGTQGFPMNGIMLNAGTVPGDTYSVCASIGGAGALSNAITGSGANGGTDFRLRQRQATTVRLPGYAGANNNNAAVVTFVQGNNGGTPTGAAANTVPTGGGFIGGAPCP